MPKKNSYITQEDGRIYCPKCNEIHDLDHFYQQVRKSGNTTYACRGGRPKRKKWFLEELGYKRKEGSKATFHIPLEDGRIFCGYCKEPHNEDHFNIVKYIDRKRGDSQVVQYTCKSNDIRFSEFNPQKIYNSNHKKSLKDYKRDVLLQREYGITLDDYNKKFIEQDGCCAICKTPQTELKKLLFVDHCHNTGNVRGLLCNTCNGGIGLLKDSIEILKQAINYLEKYK